MNQRQISQQIKYAIVDFDWFVLELKGYASLSLFFCILKGCTSVPISFPKCIMV